MIYSNLSMTTVVPSYHHVENSLMKKFTLDSKFIAAKDVSAVVNAALTSSDKYCGSKYYLSNTNCSGTETQGDYLLINSCVAESAEMGELLCVLF